MNLLDKINEKEGFTAVDQIVADFIMEHRDTIMGMTITNVAEQSYVSPGAVTRFCKRLGTDGFREFKVAFVRDAERRKDSINDVDPDNPFLSRNNADEIMHSISALIKNTIDDCTASVPARSLMTAAEWILGAERIYFYANGDSQISSISFCNRLLKIGKIGFIADQYNEKRKYYDLMKAGDVVFAVSYSGRISLSAQEIQWFRKRGVRMVLISSRDNIPGFDLKIVIPKKETYEYETKVTTFYSQTAINYIFSCLYSMIVNLQKREENRKNLKKAYE